MKKILVLVAIACMAFLMNGCIMSSSPGSPVSVTASDSLTFSVVVFPNNVTLGWYLDGNLLPGETGKSYTYSPSEGDVGTHNVMVKEISGSIIPGKHIWNVEVISEQLWPLHVGDLYVSQYSDSTGAQRFQELFITGTTVIGTKNYFTTNYTSFFIGSTKDSVYFFDGGKYKEYIVTPSTPVVSVSVPYGGPFQAYRFIEYYSYPSSYEYNYIVRGLGMIKSSEFNDITHQWWEWGDLVAFIPAP
jgi:hypothetical protein